MKHELSIGLSPRLGYGGTHLRGNSSTHDFDTNFRVLRRITRYLYSSEFDMSSEVESLRKQLREAQERGREERRLREEAQRDQEKAQQHYERRTGKTTLPEFLDACHTHLCLGLTIQPDNTQSTHGDAANAENKSRPNRILPWLEFDVEQAQTWEDLMGSNFVLERHFTSLHTLEESGEAIRQRQMGSELDLNNFARFTVRAGVEYGEIYTGEATIFLRVPDDPSTVYYPLSVPKGDVGSQTGWSESSDQPNRLHLTAVGQAVPFTLRALQTPPRSTKWRTEALHQLKTWNVVVKEVEEAIADDEVPSSEYRPSPWIIQDIRRSPIRFRPRKTKLEATTCASATSSFSSNDHPDTPSRPPQPPSSSISRTSANSITKVDGHGERKGACSGGNRQRNLGRFCTPQCLMGIIRGGKLDQTCPNAKEHGRGRHRLNHETFMQKMQQLLHDQLDYCEEMNIHGARGAFFKIKLPGFGYIVVAKATGVECVGDLIHESEIYRRLLPIQGKYIPVHLGDIKVNEMLYYAGAVRIVHMMLLSFGGFSIRPPIPYSLAKEAIRGLQAMHQLGVLQEDPAARNILVHPERGGATWIDFERAVLVTPRVVLGSLPINRKRKLEAHNKLGCLEKNSNAYAQEIAKARALLTRLVSNSKTAHQLDDVAS